MNEDVLEVGEIDEEANSFEAEVEEINEVEESEVEE